MGHSPCLSGLDPCDIFFYFRQLHLAEKEPILLQLKRFRYCDSLDQSRFVCVCVSPRTYRTMNYCIETVQAYGDFASSFVNIVLKQRSYSLFAVRMNSHDRLEGFLRWRAVGRLEEGQSQAEDGYVACKWSPIYGIHSKQNILSPGVPTSGK
ncbi:hypothetical protein TNCV_2956361 [Trichonephila clavipes]|nr:hypothetical protein TNCV_2956361 [Trichonephila clavipes]